MKFDITCVIIFARHRPHDVRTDIITPSVHDPSINKCKHRNSSFALHHVRCMLYSGCVHCCLRFTRVLEAYFNAFSYYEWVIKGNDNVITQAFKTNLYFKQIGLCIIAVHTVRELHFLF